MNISQEVLTRDEAAQIAKLDCTKHNGPKEYVQKNTFTYYVAINTWYHLIDVRDKWAAAALLDYIQRNGLLHTIKVCDKDASCLVKGEELSQIGRIIVQISKDSCVTNYFAKDPEKNFLRDDLATALQLLRYLKRFSPLDNDWVKTESINNFLSNENYTKQKQRCEYPYWLISCISEEIEEIIDWEQVIHIIDSMDDYDFSIPEGTTYEGYHHLNEKIDAIFSQHPECAYRPFGLPFVFPYYSKNTDDDTSRVQAVPKSYKAARIIAMEPVYRQARANFLSKRLQRLLPECIDVTDQTRNQKLAWAGSRTGDYATLDASNASDLISKTLFRSVIPSEVVKRIDPLFSHYTEVNGTKRTMQMMSTAGHSLTFIFETIIYYGIAAAACKYCSLFTNETYYTSVYGDDVVISSDAARTAIEFYSMLGLKINEDKSFISGPYRESCGEEYYRGCNVSSNYYPRFPVVGTISSKSISLGVRTYRDTYRGKIDDSTTMLVDLQKRLFGLSYTSSLFVWEVVKTARSKITSSSFGTICNDLWASVDSGQPYNVTDHVKDLDGNKVIIPPKVAALCETQKHSYASIQYRLGKKNHPISERNFDIFRYQSFLRSGPSYSDGLSELLGVSDPPMSLEAYMGDGVLVWRYEF